MEKKKKTGEENTQQITPRAPGLLLLRSDEI